jgi:hypothetical protein
VFAADRGDCVTRLVGTEVLLDRMVVDDWPEWDNGLDDRHGMPPQCPQPRIGPSIDWHTDHH